MTRVNSDNPFKPEYTVKCLKSSATTPSGTMRCTSVQDVRAPPNVVWNLLLDFPNYPKYVYGVTKCVPYGRRRTVTGGKVVYAHYTVNVAAGFKVKYYLEHQYEPLKNCMVWRMDYSKKSDVRPHTTTLPARHTSRLAAAAALPP